ncbi:MAG: hypothetical protein RL077_4697 [Verrucomicrobiota bacterium]
MRLLKRGFETCHHGIKNRHKALKFAIMGGSRDPLVQTVRSNPFGRLGQRKHWTQSARGQYPGATAKNQQSQGMAARNRQRRCAKSALNSVRSAAKAKVVSGLPITPIRHERDPVFAVKKRSLVGSGGLSWENSTRRGGVAVW